MPHVPFLAGSNDGTTFAGGFTRADLRSAIGKLYTQETPFHLVFQPKFEVEGAAIAGAEALVRWTCPRLGALQPADFIPVARTTGLLIELGRWVLEQACALASAWPLTTPVSVNVCVEQLMHPMFVSDVEAVLARTQLPASRLELEITEDALALDAAVVETLHEVRALGVRISIDDFGAGHTSLRYLAELPIDCLKLDRLFARGLHHNPRYAKVIGAVLDLAKVLHLDVVVEGIETAEQLHFFTAHAPLYVQGFLHGRPLPAEEMATLLANHRLQNEVRVSGILPRCMEADSAADG